MDIVPDGEKVCFVEIGDLKCFHISFNITFS